MINTSVSKRWYFKDTRYELRVNNMAIARQLTANTHSYE